jgi:hypothetical protein
MKWQTIREFLLRPRTLLVLYIGMALFASIQLVSLGTHKYIYSGPVDQPTLNKPGYLERFAGKEITEYNNYVIFKSSFFHLINQQGLYTIYPSEHWDLYKYSPTFALLMAPMAYLPDIAGLSIWNLLNALVLFFAIRMLPFKSKMQCLLLWFVAQELLTSLQNAQSNGLMCGLMIAAYAHMQRGKPALATLWLMFATFIKVYGAIGFCLFLFYPQKPKFILYAALWGIVFAACPLIVTPLDTLVSQYRSWAALMAEDAAGATGLSVAGWLKSWFGLDNLRAQVSLAGIVLFFIPLLRFKLYKDDVFRLLFVAFMLIWVVIFNHKAESPTFVIAAAGVGIWYFAMPKATWRTVLLWLVFIFTCLAGTDIFPPYVKKHFIYPYTIKVVPCIIAWCVIFAELMLLKKPENITPSKMALNE